MRCAASAMVCSPEEQKRFTVIPGTVSGQPARIAIWRAMFQPVAPSGLAQPMITSSTSPAPSFARSSAALTTWPPIFAPWVKLSAPRQLLVSGVRAVETITASVMVSSLHQVGFQECLGVIERLHARAMVGSNGGASPHAALVERCELAVVLDQDHAVAVVLGARQEELAFLGRVAVEGVVRAGI